MAKPKRPRDINHLAKLIVDTSSGNAPPDPPSTKNPAAVALGKLGGAKGGPARCRKRVITGFTIERCWKGNKRVKPSPSTRWNSNISITVAQNRRKVAR
jgi:hypothetical protein